MYNAGKIQEVLEDKKFDPIVLLVVKLVLEASDTILAVREAGRKLLSLGAEFGENKKEISPYDCVTPADPISEDHILSGIRSQFPDARHEIEEVKKIINPNNLSVLATKKQMLCPSAVKFIVTIDGIDGTEEFKNGGAEFCIPVSIRHYGELWASVIFSPAINGGLLSVSQMDIGTFYFEFGSHLPNTGFVQQVATNVFPSIRYGVSLNIDQRFSKIVYAMSKSATPKNVLSCALGLQYVACGMAHSFSHIPLPSWDTYAGWTAILAIPKKDNWVNAKGVYYQICDSKICVLKNPDWTGATGFIFGNADVVDAQLKIWQRLFG